MRSILIITIIFFLVTACSAPTVTATIPPTITLTATPFFTATPTFSPEQAQQMKAVNEMIKGWGMEASEWNYSYNTETGELGVYLAKNAFLGLRGEVKLTLADGSVVDLKSSDVSFDGGDTLNLNGYKLDENGDWVEAVEPNLRVELGQGMVESYNDMTIDFENGTKLELEFASPEARAEVKNACNIAMWAAEEAGRLGNGIEAGLNGTPVSFDEWMKRVEANGGMMSEMYSMTAHPREIGLGQAIKIPGIVDMNKCSVVMHTPEESALTRPFIGAIRMPTYWISFKTSDDGTIRISLTPAYNKENPHKFPFINKTSDKQENAKAMSQIVALWVEDMSRLKNTTTDVLLLDGVEKEGDPRRIDANSVGVNKYDLEKFMTEHPEAATKWLGLAE